MYAVRPHFSGLSSPADDVRSQVQNTLTECEQISKFCTTLGSMKSIEVAIHA
jgi:hypothetical protein